MRKPTKDTLPNLSQMASNDRRAVRFSSVPASELPPLTLPAREVADRGIIRLGSTGITSER